MKNTKKFMILFVSTIVTLSLAGCSGRTETGSKDADGALKAFNAIVKANPNNKGFHNALQHWGFKLSNADKFEWTKDTSANKIDYAMVMEADPLIKAGLDVTKLDPNKWVYKPAEVEAGVQLPNRLIFPYNVSDKKETSNGSEDAFRRVLKQDPNLIKYIKDEKHYMLILGEGNSVHFTETLGSSDEYMEFVLKAEPLIKAGLDVTKLEGTGFKLEVAGKDNMESNDDQLVKGYKLK
ncbi:hypothetical protein LGK97_02455 [Clostridium sp. CS001]|uniref:hypothetical protein n=1 Tax=Clostridium sp. CS001 TaxID=2880648 RepID=UPI001CF4A200|nr:hypothetical protein [Clostridium sp. CS001]MCB2288625.1 hypothetical protein [Clostridium sp. CS001]